MSTQLDSIESGSVADTHDRSTWLARLGRRIVLSRLDKIQEGQIVIHEHSGQLSFGRVTTDFPFPVHVQVLSPRFYSYVAFGGEVGAGDAYIQGYWACKELGELIRILIRNRDVLEKMDAGLALLSAPLKKCLLALNRNTRKGSRKNIAAHYDLGNDFYQLWLDSKMMYSCAIFATPNTSLEEASTAKLERICRKLQLSADDSVIEIGSGWAGFAIYAAKNCGCHVTTTTISKEQYNYAKQAISDAGLDHKITLLCQDYRDLDGRFDKLVSIEMIEAVGHEFHDDYFKKCCSLLKPDGQMLLQAITMADQHYEEYKSSVDFIKRYIFPGGCLVSVTEICQSLTGHTDMRVVQLDDIGPHYATTLRKWHDRFFSRLDEVRKLGYPDAFIRMWQYYLCYCESAFIERAIGTVQLLIVRPQARAEIYP